MRTNQTVVVNGDKIADVGPSAQVQIPAGAQVIDLGNATVLPGLIDAHTHMFNTPKPGMSREASTLIAIQHLQRTCAPASPTIRDMSTHGNGYGDVDIRDAINRGQIDGPRAVSRPAASSGGRRATTSRAIRLPARSSTMSKKAARRCATRSRMAPTGSNCSRPAPIPSRRTAQPKYVLTYPMPVLQAMIDETHRLGHKTGCHVYGGEGQKNAILAGCDTIEHAFGLDQEQANMMVAKGLYYDPTLVRYQSPTWTTTTTRRPAANTA